MSQMVQFGMNTFAKPKGFVFGKAHSITEWRNQVRERRERLLELADSSHEVSGQELNPQNQRQQLTAKVDSSKRGEFVQVVNKIFPERPIRLEHVFDPAERRGNAPTAKRQSPVVSKPDLEASSSYNDNASPRMG